MRDYINVIFDVLDLLVVRLTTPCPADFGAYTLIKGICGPALHHGHVAQVRSAELAYQSGDGVLADWRVESDCDHSSSGIASIPAELMERCMAGRSSLMARCLHRNRPHHILVKIRHLTTGP